MIVSLEPSFRLAKGMGKNISGQDEIHCLAYKLHALYTVSKLLGDHSLTLAHKFFYLHSSVTLPIILQNSLHPKLKEKD